MKKTLIAMAAIAATGLASAQVAITGGADFTWGKSTASATNGSVSRGLAATDAYIDVAASEDLGGGWSAKAAMEFNADGAWGANAYTGDHSVTLAGPAATLTLINTRSGGILNAIMLAPEVNPTDHWNSTAVMQRAGVDAAVISGTVAQGLKMAYKYVESGADGYGTPGALTHVIGAYYVNGPVGLNYEFNSRAYPDNVSGDVRLVRHDVTGTYDAGFAKFALGYESGGLNTWNGTSAGTAGGAFLASMKGTFGSSDLGLNYGKRDDASFVEVAAQYNFSKSTYIAASYGTYTQSATTVTASAASAVTGGAFSSDSYGVRVGKNF
jgi:hypothetical protein